MSKPNIKISDEMPVNSVLYYFKDKDFNFNMNKTQESFFNFGVKKSRIEGVCVATNSDSST
jgi:hypothetical protein